MERRTPQLIWIVFADAADPAQYNDLRRWFEGHLPEMLKSDVVSHALLYERAESAEDQPHFMVIYELTGTDPQETTRRYTAFVDALHARGRIHPARKVIRRVTWQRTGREAFATDQSGPPGGVFVVESNCTAVDREAEFNRWYDEVHFPDFIGTGVFSAAYRFTAADPQHTGGRYLALYESVGDPLSAVATYSRDHRPKLKTAGRLSDMIEVTWHGVYRRGGYTILKNFSTYENGTRWPTR